MKVRFFLASCVLLLCSCGRFGPPKPPEDFAPKSVSSIEAKATADSVTISFKSPEKDIHGKELKSLEGYRIYRVKETDIKSDGAIDRYLTEVATIDDNSLAEREEQRKAAREANQLSHRIKVPDEKRNFNFEDKDLKVGEVYIYRIEAFNQGGVKGKPSQLIKVLFKGEQSDIFIVPNEDNLDTAVGSVFDNDTMPNEGSGLMNLGK